METTMTGDSLLEQQFLTLREVAAKLNTSTRSVERSCKEGNGPPHIFVRRGTRRSVRRFPSLEFEHYLKKMLQQQS
jgi:hypothetical protein